MPRAAKLKVFRTPIGFHDAYVAAPSQKAAMEAWGSDRDLFARGEAELVTDEALVAEPLAHPGTVIKRLRGTAAEQIAALPPDKPPSARGRAGGEPPSSPARHRPPRKPAAPPPPRPDRAKLDSAEEALVAAERRHTAERKDLAAREKALARERHEMEAAQAAEAERLEDARARAADTYQVAMRKWRGDD
jgi:hypothetical protein